jgi:hypothetical protein
VIVAHILGIPVEENAVQLAPTAAAMATALAIAGRVGLRSLHRRFRRRLPGADR